MCFRDIDFLWFLVLTMAKCNLLIIVLVLVLSEVPG